MILLEHSFYHKEVYNLFMYSFPVRYYIKTHKHFIKSDTVNVNTHISQSNIQVMSVNAMLYYNIENSFNEFA